MENFNTHLENCCFYRYEDGTDTCSCDFKKIYQEKENLRKQRLERSREHELDCVWSDPNTTLGPDSCTCLKNKSIKHCETCTCYKKD